MNLNPLNVFIEKRHFKMEGVQMVKDLLRKDDYMASIDLKDAYLSVSEEHRSSIDQASLSYSLQPAVCQKAMQMLGPCHIDLFVT